MEFVINNESKSFIIIEYNSVHEYINEVVLQMDTEAEDLALYSMPVVLRIPIQTVLMAKDAGVEGQLGIVEEIYPASLNDDQKWISKDDELNFHE